MKNSIILATYSLIGKNESYNLKLEAICEDGQNLEYEVTFFITKNNIVICMNTGEIGGEELRTKIESQFSLLKNVNIPHELEKLLNLLKKYPICFNSLYFEECYTQECTNNIVTLDGNEYREVSFFWDRDLVINKIKDEESDECLLELGLANDIFEQAVEKFLGLIPKSQFKFVVENGIYQLGIMSNIIENDKKGISIIYSLNDIKLVSKRIKGVNTYMISIKEKVNKISRKYDCFNGLFNGVDYIYTNYISDVELFDNTISTCKGYILIIDKKTIKKNIENTIKKVLKEFMDKVKIGGSNIYFKDKCYQDENIEIYILKTLP